MASIKLSDEFIAYYNIQDVLEQLSGGQKDVFIVRINNQLIALKIIKVADERILREIEISKKFTENPGIPSIIDVSNYENETVIIEEYIDGYDLSDVAINYKDNEAKTLKLILDISTILTPIWESNYVHRDLKPKNIRVDIEGNPYILDFGIARALDDDSLTISGYQPLTPIFGSPEQYDGKKDLISYRTDFFCLGLIAYYNSPHI